jgi:UDPglucose 6-dehydrogenase
MKITIIGTGYVGLVSGAVFSNLGHHVTCVDIDEEKIKLLSAGHVGIYEPNLQDKISNALRQKTLVFSCSYESLQFADAAFIAVGTPQFENGDADLSYVYNALAELAAHISKKTIIVVKSTVPPQTCIKISDYLKRMGLDNDVVMNPEFLREGSALEDFLKPERIVIGCNSASAKDTMLQIYDSWRDSKKIVTDTTTAEMIKYASNTFLATKIAFINEMADICAKVNADVEMLSYGVGLDKRIGKDFLKVGPGFGGSCFPKDINALIHIVRSHNIDNKILDAVLESNRIRKFHMLEKIRHIVGMELEGKTIGVLGLAFKANTDDVRYSPAMQIVQLLLEQGAEVNAFDPQGMNNARSILPEINYCQQAENVAKNADCIVILTEWPQFQSLDFQLIKKLMSSPVIIDLRNILNAEAIGELGFSYYRI